MNIFKKMITLIADLFPKLRTSKKSRFRGPLDKQHGQENQTMLKPEPHHLYHIYWSLWKQLSSKKSLLVISKVLRMFVNILTANDQYFLPNRDNLRQPMQRQLYQKQRFFSRFFSAILKSRLNFEHFQRKDDPHSWYICEITDPKKRGSINV